MLIRSFRNFSCPPGSKKIKATQVNPIIFYTAIKQLAIFYNRQRKKVISPTIPGTIQIQENIKRLLLRLIPIPVYLPDLTHINHITNNITAILTLNIKFLTSFPNPERIIRLFIRLTIPIYIFPGVIHHYKIFRREITSYPPFPQFPFFPLLYICNHNTNITKKGSANCNPLFFCYKLNPATTRYLNQPLR